MKKLLGIGIGATLLFATVTVLTLNWLIHEDPLKFFLSPAILDGKANGIYSVDVEMTNRKIYLDVHLEHPQSCNTVIKSLGIGPFNLRNRIYVPSCAEVSENLIKVVYIETAPS